MNVGDVWQRTILRRAALRYADHGWAVMPGAMFTLDRYVCGPMRLTVGCHPAVNRWEITASSQSSDVDSWWALAPFSVLLPTGLNRWSLPDSYAVQAHLVAQLPPLNLPAKLSMAGRRRVA
jgi:Bifunctional DNA primase/polymerase, N-terminal